MKKRLFFDMDNVLVNFQSGINQLDEATRQDYASRLDEVPGIFSLMKPVEGAPEAVRKLAEFYDVFILSTAPWNNPSAWSDKVEWVKKYFDSPDKDPNKNPFHKRMIITHRKDLCEGDYLIDDRGKNGTSEFKGEWIKFGSTYFPDWNAVTEYLLIRKNREKSKTTVKQLLENRNTYSWAALFILLLCETFAFCGIHCSWCVWGPWTFLASLLVIAIGIIGRFLSHKFNLRSVILTKLLANAISPQPLGTLYLFLFVVHIGWLTNAVMNLFMPDDLVDVAISVGICIFGLIILICFFPEGKPNKDGADGAVFISGISMFAKNKDKISLVVNGENKDYTQILNKNTEMVVSTFDMCFKNENEKISKIEKENVKKLLILNTDAHYKKDFFKDTVIDVTNLNMTNEEMHHLFGEDKGIIRSIAGKESVYLELNCSDVEDSVKTVIRITAIQKFPKEKEYFKNLCIDLTKECDYDSFETCFEILNDAIKKVDDNKQRLYFNLTPGTGIVGSLMTLFSLDKHRELYYYAQFTSHELLPVVKSRIPLENLLSQALETISDNK